MSGTDLASQLTVERLLEIWRSIPHPKFGFGYPPETSVLHIKHKGFGYQLSAEGRTQQYAMRTWNNRPYIRIHKVYRIVEYIFGKQGEMIQGGESFKNAFLIMEYMHEKALREIMTEYPRAFWQGREEFYGRVATGVSLLLDIRPPNEQTPGPVGGGLVRNPVFGDDCRAKCLYRSVKEIENHFNAVRLLLNSRRGHV